MSTLELLSAPLLAELPIYARLLCGRQAGRQNGVERNAKAANTEVARQGISATPCVMMANTNRDEDKVPMAIKL